MSKPTSMLEDQKEYWNRVADEKDFTTPFRIEIFSQYLPLPANILDFGCGYGRTLFSLYKAGYTNARGIDLSENMISRGKSIHPYLNLSIYSGETLPFEDNSFDAIIGLAIFTCIPNSERQSQTMGELYRILKPGGYIYLNDFLLTDDERNLTRYEKFQKKYKTYGIFELPSGGVFRHHSLEYFNQLIDKFTAIISSIEVFKTMNGNLTNGIFFLGQKPH
ncbi:MAG: class I SAM-dependent methyltransferase [Promethearchaeota archaeon]